MSSSKKKKKACCVNKKKNSWKEFVQFFELFYSRPRMTESKQPPLVGFLFYFVHREQGEVVKFDCFRGNQACVAIQCYYYK